MKENVRKCEKMSENFNNVRKSEKSGRCEKCGKKSGLRGFVTPYGLKVSRLTLLRPCGSIFRGGGASRFRGAQRRAVWKSVRLRICAEIRRKSPPKTVIFAHFRAFSRVLHVFARVLRMDLKSSDSQKSIERPPPPQAREMPAPAERQGWAV